MQRLSEAWRVRRGNKRESPQRHPETGPAQKKRSVLPLQVTPKRTSRTFRLRGISANLDVTGVQSLVKRQLGLEEHVNVYVRSLAQSPEDPGAQTATFEFSVEPENLPNSNPDRTEWLLNAPGELIGPVLDVHFHGLTPLHSGPDSDRNIDVVAISGLGGHAFGSFKKKDSSYMWLRESLPHDLPRVRVFIYGYDSKLQNSQNCQTINDMAIPFRNAIIRMMGTRDAIPLMRGTGEENTDKVPLILIGHSMGGIILKQAIVQMAESKDDYDKRALKSICGIFLYGVPNRGMPVDHLVAMVGDQPNRQLLETLRSSSFLLQNLSRTFPEKFHFRDAEIISYYETLHSQIPKQNPDGSWVRSGEARLLVDYPSATHSRDWESGHTSDQYVCPIDRDHSDLVKFRSPQDQHYEDLRHRLGKLCKRAPQIIQNRFFGEDKEWTEKYKECLKSLSFPWQSNRMNDIVDATGTCEWLLQHHNYVEWASSSHGMIWVKGKPGSGKSTLMKFVTQETAKQIGAADICLASFFVYGQGSSMQKSKLGLARSLLQQIFDMSPNPPNSSKDLVRKYKERCRLEGQHRKDWDWTTGELQTCLGNSIREVAENVQIILFVDALDELGKDVALEVIDYFQDLLVNVDQNFKICFSCRHYPNLSTYDEDSICLEDENDGDIRTCIHSKLRRYQESLKLENKIAEIANGVFQWAVLVTAHVIDLETSGYSYHFLEQNLQHMPQKLHELYSHLLKNPSDQTVRLLQWVYFSCEPLTWGAIRHAMAVDPGAPRRSIITCEMESGWGNSESEAAKLINTLSRGLVQIAIAAQPHNTGSEEKVKTVHFIHQSVSDFLFSKGLEEIHVALSDQAAGSAQVYLCKTCLAYLGTSEIQDHAESSWQEGGNILDRFPLLQYSARYWPKHAKLASDLGTDQQYLVDSFSYPRSTLGGAYEKTAKYFDDDWNSYDTIISVCAGIQKHFGVDKDKSYEGTIIHVLARYGLFTALKILISHGDAFLGVLDRRHETPLHAAVRNGSVEIVDYLLSQGLSPNARNEAHATPLHIAAEFGYLQIAILLLRVGAERDPNNCLNSEPDINLEPGAIISGHFEPYKGPLTYAIENHHWQVAELLLDLTGLSEAGQSSDFVDQSSSDSPERHFVEKMWRVLGRLHPLSILALWHSTGALRSREKLGEARSMDQAFIESFDSLSERESQRQAWNVMEEFASMYVSRQQFKYAEEVYTQLRMSRETCLGMDDPETLKSTFEFIEKVRWGKFNPPDVEEYESTPQEGPQLRIPTHPWGARLFRGRSSL